MQERAPRDRKALQGCTKEKYLSSFKGRDASSPISHTVKEEAVRLQLAFLDLPSFADIQFEHVNLRFRCNSRVTILIIIFQAISSHLFLTLQSSYSLCFLFPHRHECGFETDDE